jgi:uncharacterized repeat protein (TIGR03803 family)
MDKTGALYGVTGAGGYGQCGYLRSHFMTYIRRVQYPAGCGTVFKLTPPAAGGDAWTLTTLHKFTNAPDGDGAFPDGGVIFAPGGSLLGATHGSNFGNFQAYGFLFSNYWAGTVFQLTPPASGGTVWTQTILYAFGTEGTGFPAGVFPRGGLVQDRDGVLFGTTDDTVFQLSPPSAGTGRWTKTTLHSFRGPDFIEPSAGLIHDTATGAFYGVTGLVHGDNGGTVFSLTRPVAGKILWREAVLHRFRANDGRNPQARLSQDPAGNLYGTTENGGAHLYGTVFRVAP